MSGAYQIGDEITQKAKKIKLFAMDVDGILSDGKIIYDANGIETKAFFVQDGVGINALHSHGIITAIITGRSSAMVEKRAKELGICHIIQGRDDKFVALKGLADELGLPLEACAYMGDDLPDLKAIANAGLGFSVPNGCQAVQAVADVVTERAGGNGAVREAAEIILNAKGVFDDYVNQFR